MVGHTELSLTPLLLPKGVCRCRHAAWTSPLDFTFARAMVDESPYLEMLATKEHWPKIECVCSHNGEFLLLEWVRESAGQRVLHHLQPDFCPELTKIPGLSAMIHFVLNSLLPFFSCSPCSSGQLRHHPSLGAVLLRHLSLLCRGGLAAPPQCLRLR